MARYLVKTVETWRVDTEDEAKALIEETKQDSISTLIKSSSETRTTKAKGEICDEWRRVTLTRNFNEEKEPYGTYTVEYTNA